MPKVNLLHSEDHDWVGIYIDGKLVDEGHSFTPEMVLEAIGAAHQSLTLDFEAADWGRCPAAYAEVEAQLAVQSKALGQGSLNPDDLDMELGQLYEGSRQP